jgi:hypothetical protein
MKYNKPEILVLGEANRTILGCPTGKNAPDTDGCNGNTAAYDLDE